MPKNMRMRQSFFPAKIIAKLQRISFKNQRNDEK